MPPSRGLLNSCRKTAASRPAKPSDWLRAGLHRGTGHRSAARRAARCRLRYGATRSTPPAQTAPDRCWRACCTRSAPAKTLVVVRLDRLARSVSHLLAVIEQLEAQGAQPARSHRAGAVLSPGARSSGDGARHLQREHALRWWCRSDTHAKMTPIFPLCGRNSAPTGGRLMTGRRFMRCGWRRAWQRDR